MIGDDHDLMFNVPFNIIYRTRPNYRTVHLGFSKLLGTVSCGKICTLYLPTRGTL